MNQKKLSELKKLDEELYKEEKEIERLIESHNKKVGDLVRDAFVLGCNRLDFFSRKLELL